MDSEQLASKISCLILYDKVTSAFRSLNVLRPRGRTGLVAKILASASRQSVLSLKVFDSALKFDAI